MTMIVFDGKHFWADGISSFVDKRLADMNIGYFAKVTVLDVPIKTASGYLIKALAGTGSTEDIKSVSREFNRAGKLGEEFEHIRKRLHLLLGDKMDCWIVGVGTNQTGKGVVPISLSLFKPARWDGCNFNYNPKNSNYVMAGDSLRLPMGYECDWMKNGGEVIALSSILNPRGVGGQISRYDPVTGKLDHPKPLNEQRQRSLLKKWKQHKLNELAKEITDAENALSVRFPKDDLGRGIL